MNAKDWALRFLAAMNIPATPEVVRFVAAWAQREGTRAAFNPLATSRIINRGETNFNSHGVKNYKSAEDGIEATRQTLALQSYGYPAIVDALRRNHIEDAIAALANSQWGTGTIGLNYGGVHGDPLTYVLPSFPAGFGGGGGSGWGNSPAEQFGGAIGTVAGAVAGAQNSGASGVAGALSAPFASRFEEAFGVALPSGEAIVLVVVAVILIFLAIVLFIVPLLAPVAQGAAKAVL